MNIYKGTGAAKGQALANVIVLREDNYEITKMQISEQAVKKEEEKLKTARASYCRELEDIYDMTVQSLGEESAQIFSAYKEIAMDDVFFAQVLKRREQEQCNVEYALQEEKKSVLKMMESIDDAYIRERAADIENVCKEIIKGILGMQTSDTGLKEQKDDFIVVAGDLSPEDTIRLDKKYLKGFVTEKGGKTSHTVILAKTLGIPAVIGVPGICDKAAGMERIYINGETGEVAGDPDEALITQYQKAKEASESQKRELEKLAQKEAITIDGYKIKICVNTGDQESLNSLDAKICDGIGLFRTEFLYMNHKGYPTEEEQFAVYQTAVQKMEGKEVVIRTLDIGGDKQLDYMELPKEANPFLGYRAIRICLDRKEMFITQLKAILRASAYGSVAIMFPMIVNLEELREAKELVKEAMRRLDSLKENYDKEIKIGVMIETPSAVLLSDKLAREADFFSIGTNDLIQYTTATDRMNEKVQYLYDSCNVSVLRAVRLVAQNAHKEGIEVSICGEAASDEMLIPLWAAMKINKLSMAQAQTMKIKYIITRLSVKEQEALCGQVLEADTMEEVKKYLHSICP